MREVILTKKSSSESIESRELSHCNESSMELSEDMRVFEEYNKEVDKLLGDESLEESGPFANNSSESSPSLSKDNETSDREDSPVIEMKIWDNKESKRDDSADFNKKFLKLSQKAKKRKNPLVGNILKKLEKFKLEDRSGAKVNI
jgi:hypothetical protein